MWVAEGRGERAPAPKRTVPCKLTPEVAALYVIHYAGFSQDMEAARQLADSAGLPLVEDCALALLSRNGDKPLGSYGDLSIFCLYKTLPVPNGGALLARGELRH